MRLYQAKELCYEIKKAIQSANDRGQFLRVQQLKEARRKIRARIDAGKYPK